MVEMRVNKSEAARRQIEAAIRLLFSSEDPIAVHTLTAAGFRILCDLAHVKKSKMQRAFKHMINPEKEKDFWKAINRAANFLKHAKNDPEDILEGVNEEINDSMLMLSCMHYDDLGYQLTPTMKAFGIWFLTIYPDLLSDEAPLKKINIKELTLNLQSADRAEQLKRGRIFLERAKSLIK